MFVYLAADPASAGDTATASCEVDFFASGGGGKSDRCGHASFELPEASAEGRYHAFRVAVPKVAGRAAVSFAAARGEAAQRLISPDVFLVPTANLTYAPSDPDNHRTFCPIPIGRLHCYFTTALNSRYQLVPQFAAAGSAPDAKAPRASVTYQPMFGTAEDRRAKAQGLAVAPVTLPLREGARRFRFRAIAGRALIDVEFNDLPEGALLRCPLEPIAVAPDLRAERVSLSEEGAESADDAIVPAGALLNAFDQLLKSWKAPLERLGFAAAVATSSQQIESPMIIAITGEFLASHLTVLSGFVSATEEDALELLRGKLAQAPGIILVESLFYRAGRAWQCAGTTAITEDERLQDLLRSAGEAGWSRVLWFSEDPVHVDAFSPRFGLFDRVVSETEIGAAADEAAARRVTAHLPFVDLRLANPIVAVPPGKTLGHVALSRGPFERRTLVVGWADILEGAGIDQVLDSATLHHVEICEEQWKLEANRAADFPRIAANVVGFLDQRQLISAFKRYGAALFFYPSLRSDVQLRRNVMLAAACYCLPIICCAPGAAGPLRPLEDLAVVTDDPDRVRELIGRIGAENPELARRRHLIWRSVASSNAGGYRLASALGIERHQLPRRIETVVVSIVTVTKRPELLIQTYRQICRQLHSSWEWIVVLNRRDVAPSQLPDEIKTDYRVRVLAAAPSKNLGFCMELGIADAKGAVWLKWDDDDFYGPGYLRDTLLLAQMTDAALLGRPPTYVYRERDRSLFRRPRAAAGFVLSPKEFRQTGLVGGASLAGRLDSGRTVTFGFDRRGSVDTDYMAAVAEAGAAICSGPSLGMVMFRAADAAFHTWRLPESALLLNADRIGGEEALASVLI